MYMRTIRNVIKVCMARIMYMHYAMKAEGVRSIFQEI